MDREQYRKWAEVVCERVDRQIREGTEKYGKCPTAVIFSGGCQLVPIVAKKMGYIPENQMLWMGSRVMVTGGQSEVVIAWDLENVENVDISPVPEFWENEWLKIPDIRMRLHWSPRWLHITIAVFFAVAVLALIVLCSGK